MYHSNNTTKTDCFNSKREALLLYQGVYMTIATNCPVCGDTNIGSTSGTCKACGQNTTYTTISPYNEAPLQGAVEGTYLEGSILG